MNFIYRIILISFFLLGCNQKEEYKELNRNALSMNKTDNPSIIQYVLKTENKPLNGKYKIMDPNRYFTGTFVNGLLEENVNHYKQKGDKEYQLWMQSFYVKGELNGQYKTYNEAGKLIEIKHYRKGKVMGKEEFK